MSSAYSAESENGLRWNDPSLSIEWPTIPMVVSEKDQRWSDLSPEHHGIDVSVLSK